MQIFLLLEPNLDIFQWKCFVLQCCQKELDLNFISTIKLGDILRKIL